jgi:magnesium transporter
MSDHEDISFDTGYSTPVPELDDHTNQSVSVQKPRSRRGTVDTMYSTMAKNLANPDLGAVNDKLQTTQARDFQGAVKDRLQPFHARDFEEAIIDEESGGVSPRPGRAMPDSRSRRGTVTTLDPRSVSPPNSVKAFADARRRERELSTSDPNGGKSFAEARRQDDCSLYRVKSHTSGRSCRTRRFTNDNDGKSFASSHKSAEEDVCFPLHDSSNKDDLLIDFEGLEEFIAEEEIRDKTPPPNQPQARIFKDLRPQTFTGIPKIVDSDGNAVGAPSMGSSSLDVKDEKHPDSVYMHEFGPNHPAADINRFEYFSSLAESTIHAAEFGDLILPGEDIRTLFTFPEGEEDDGVWWLNMNNPTDEEIRAICRAFGVHPLTIEDIGTQEAREKIELVPSYYFACFRSFHVDKDEDGQGFAPFNIYVVVFREGTLSFSFSPNPHAANVRKRITTLKDYVALSSDWICYALM